MKKYLNKALIYKEWKNAWWLLIPMIIMNNKYIAMLNIVNNKGTWIENSYLIFFGHNNDASFDIANVLFLMCLALLLMNRDEKNNEFLCYLPFTKKQVLFSKIGIGISIIFISILAEAAICSGIYFANADIFTANIGFTYIIIHFILKILCYICIFLVCVYMQHLVSNGFFGAVLGLAAVHLPASVDSLFYLILLDGQHDATNLSVYIIIDKILNKFYIPYYVMNVWTFKINELIIRSLIVCFFSFVIFILMIRLATNTRLEDDKITISKKKRIAVKVFISISIGSFFAYIIQLAIVNAARRLFIVFIYLALLIAAYFVFSFLDKKFKLSKL